MPTHEALSLPYKHLNLRRNPFGRMTRDEKNQLVVLRIDLSPYVKRLKKPGYAVQFLKEGAKSKTTHLLAIRRHFPAAPYIRLFEGQPAPPFPQSPILFVDWFHALPKEYRAQLLQRPSSFAVVSHINHRREFRRAGLEYDLIELPVQTIDQMTKQIDRCLEWARREPEKPVPTISRTTLARLLNRLGDDAAVYDHLYEVFEQLTEVRHV